MLVGLAVVLGLVIAMRSNKPDAIAQEDFKIRAWHDIDGLSLAQFETVFWEPDDTLSARQWIASDNNVPGKRILEIGPGTGLLALCCLNRRAEHVTAIDINPAAVANTRYNAEQLGFSERLTVLQSEPNRSPLAKLERGSKFDLIVSNPPWEDGTIETVDQYALYDPGLRLCDQLLSESPEWLKPGGKLLLIYGARKAIEHIQNRAPEHGWLVTIMDDRDLKTLPEVFLPGMMLELNLVTQR